MTACSTDDATTRSAEKKTVLSQSKVAAKPESTVVVRPELLVRKADLARLLSVSPRSIEAWVASRRIPAYKLGRRCIRFSLPEVLQALDRFKIEEVKIKA